MTAPNKLKQLIFYSYMPQHLPKIVKYPFKGQLSQLMSASNIIPLSELRMKDVAIVGGKNASLGELIGSLAAAGVRVPGGFAITTNAYRAFMEQNNLHQIVQQKIADLNVNNTTELARVGADIRQCIMNTPLPDAVDADIRHAYNNMEGTPAVAVRSSATAEDMPDASFAGQQETFLNLRGEDAVIDATRRVFASLFTDRAVSYRRHRGYEAVDVAISVAVQQMVRSDLSASGVMFTLDTESGFEEVVFITAAYGLGENVVQGAVNPDEFYVYKPSLRNNCASPIIRRKIGEKSEKMILGDSQNVGASVKNVRVEEAERRRFCITDEDAKTLAQYALAIEKHYACAMDIEWAKDGESGELFIVQARPETVKSRVPTMSVTRYRILEKGEKIAEGRAIGQKIGVGIAQLINSSEDMHRIGDGDVLVADMTDPDWEPVMKRARAIVTRRGGRTCHAAIIARELGVPAIVGCGDSLAALTEGQQISVCCAEGDTGNIYQGEMKYEIEEFSPEMSGDIDIKLQINIANPDLAFDFSRLPSDGVGLARLEFIIARTIGFHPRCALDYATLSPDLQQEVRRLSAGYDSPRECYISKIAEGAATIAAAFAPRPVIVRLSDFKSNEYAGLVGGRQFEPNEENPMIGFRGAARYIDDNFSDCFALECEAMRRTQEQMGISNIWLMVPFVRTTTEAAAVIQQLGKFGINRDLWKLIMMCEVPANALLAEEFLQYFDGFSIGSNDLTQLTLALDRDSELVAGIFDERNPAVKMMISRAIQACRAQNKYVGICGQAPSDHPEFAQWLMEEGISAISLNPDTLIETRMRLAQKWPYPPTIYRSWQ